MKDWRVEHMSAVVIGSLRPFDYRKEEEGHVKLLSLPSRHEAGETTALDSICGLWRVLLAASFICFTPKFSLVATLLSGLTIMSVMIQIVL
jgi:hypothetical protein